MWPGNGPYNFIFDPANRKANILIKKSFQHAVICNRVRVSLGKYCNKKGVIEVNG